MRDKADKRLWTLSIVGCVIVVLTVLFVSVKIETNNTKKRIHSTMEYIKDQYSMYNSFNEAVEARSLVRMVEKVQQTARNFNLREGEERHEETRPQPYSEPPLKKKGPRKKGPPPAYSLLSSAPRLGNEKSLSGERPFHDSVSSGYFQPPPSARQTLTMDDRRSLRAAASCISLSNNERSASSTSRYEE